MTEPQLTDGGPVGSNGTNGAVRRRPLTIVVAVLALAAIASLAAGFITAAENDPAPPIWKLLIYGMTILAVCALIWLVAGIFATPDRSVERDAWVMGPPLLIGMGGPSHSWQRCCSPAGRTWTPGGTGSRTSSAC